MYKKLVLVLALILPSFAYAQKTPSFVIKGRVTNQIDNIIIGNIFQADPNTGDLKKPTDKKLVKKPRVREIRLENSGNFTLEDVSFADGDTEISRIIVDSQNQMAAIIFPNKEMQQNNTIDVGVVKLKKLVLFEGSFRFPGTVSKKVMKNLQINLSTFHGQDLIAYAASRGTDQNTFSFKVLPGQYDIYFDYKDDTNNYARVVQQVTVGDQGLILDEPIFLQPTLDQIASNPEAIRTLIQKLKIKDSEQIWQKDNRFVILYFFAGYCAFCFSNKGMVKELDIAATYPDRVSLFIIHADAYETSEKVCPQSLAQMKEWMTKPTGESPSTRWQTLYKRYQKTKSLNSNVHIAWESPELSKNLFLNGYPTILIFQNGELQGPSIVGDEFDVHGFILGLLSEIETTGSGSQSR